MSADATGSLEQRLRRLEDRNEITHLVHDYTRFLDHGDHDAMAELFADDAIIDYGPALGGELQGREKIRAWLQGIHLFERTSHHLSNVQIWFDGEDRARGTCYVLAWHEWPDDRPNAVLYGRYQDVYRRTADGWLIAERRELTHGQENFDIDWCWIDRMPPT